MDYQVAPVVPCLWRTGETNHTHLFIATIKATPPVIVFALIVHVLYSTRTAVPEEGW